MRFGVLAAGTASASGEFNLLILQVSPLPTEPVESGASLSLSATVGIQGSQPLATSAVLEFSLRRQDKPEACVSAVALIPPSSQWMESVFAATATINTAGGDGVSVIGRGSADVTLNVSGSSFTHNQSTQLEVHAEGNSTVDANITGNNFDGDPAVAGNVGIDLAVREMVALIS